MVAVSFSVEQARAGRVLGELEQRLEGASGFVYLHLLEPVEPEHPSLLLLYWKDEIALRTWADLGGLGLGENAAYALTRSFGPEGC